MRPAPTPRWLATRIEAYGLAITALGFNLPLLALALARHLEGVAATSIAGLYALLVMVGWYGLILLVIATAAFGLLSFSRRLAVAGAAAVFFTALTYLVANGFVYRVYRFHVDAFWLGYLATDSAGLGAPPALLMTAAAVVLAVAASQWAVFRLARRFPHRLKFAAGLWAVAVAAFAAGQAIHAVAYHRNDTRITRLTPQLPFYYPLTSRRNAARYGDLLALGLAPDAPQAPATLRYPLQPVEFPPAPGARRPNIVMIVLESWRWDMMDPVVSPRIAALGDRSSVFERHFSSGNSTPSGIFGLFYGLHPTYWTAVKANSASIHNPLLIDALQARGYALGIFADSHFERHKIKDAMFAGIPVEEAFDGALDDQRDADLTRRMIGFMDSTRAGGRPFFAFAFYKSTHYSYWYPPEAARFRPSAKLNIALAGNHRDPTLYLNDYRNAIHYADSLVGRVLDHLEAAGLLDSTVVLVTSDHGEEFNDNQAGYWGHTGNFTQYQIRVPLVVHLPGSAPRRIEAPTAHVDVAPTLMKRVLDVPADLRDYSNGLDLFGPLPAKRPLVVTSYVNHGIVLGDDVHAVYPMYVHRYTLENIRTPAGPPPPELVKQALEEMHRFHGTAAGRTTRTDPGPSAGARPAPAVPLGARAARARIP